MAYFSRQSVSRAVMGRPLNQPAQTFAAILYARLSGHSRKRAQEIIAANPNAASGGIWAVAGDAAASGVKTAEEFQQWLQGAEESTEQ